MQVYDDIITFRSRYMLGVFITFFFQQYFAIRFNDPAKRFRLDVVINREMQLEKIKKNT